MDLTRATLRDLVEGVLQSQLGYSEEVAIMIGGQSIYDIEMEDQLSKTLSELGVRNQTFITVLDEDDQDLDPRVNLDLIAIERYPSTKIPDLCMGSTDHFQNRTGL